MNTNRTAAFAEMTNEQRENVIAMEVNQGYEFTGMNGFDVYMHNNEQMKCVKIDNRGRGHAVK